jgi:HK97 family phage major capsid protein
MAELRKLKNNDGQYILRESIVEGTPDTLLGRPVYCSPNIPVMAAGAKVMVFGDLKHYWIGDRQGKTFQRLNETFALQGQVGYLATERVDGILVLPEAVKTLQMAAETTESTETPESSDK